MIKNEQCSRLVACVALGPAVLVHGCSGVVHLMVPVVVSIELPLIFVAHTVPDVESIKCFTADTQARFPETLSGATNPTNMKVSRHRHTDWRLTDFIADTPE